MPCIDGIRPLLGLSAGLLGLGLVLTGCAGRPAPQTAPAAPVAPATAAAAAAVSPGRNAPPPTLPRTEPVRAQPIEVDPAPHGNEMGAARADAPNTKPTKAAPRFVQLGPPKTPRSWDELRLQAAQRLVAAHPDTSYVGTPPSVLLAVPILEVELYADGSVRHINVLRVPGQAQDTTQLAVAAVRRAAPFGDVSRLSKPWKFVETFLFDDDRRFMPRVLDR